MAKKAEPKVEQVIQEPTIAESSVETNVLTLVTFDIDKIKAIYGFMPTTLYIVDKEVSESNLTFEVTQEQYAKVQDFI